MRRIRASRVRVVASSAIIASQSGRRIRRRRVAPLNPQIVIGVEHVVDVGQHEADVAGRVPGFDGGVSGPSRGVIRDRCGPTGRTWRWRPRSSQSVRNSCPARSPLGRYPRASERFGLGVPHAAGRGDGGVAVRARGASTNSLGLFGRSAAEIAIRRRGANRSRPGASGPPRPRPGSGRGRGGLGRCARPVRSARSSLEP